eukprot:GHVS01026572.1.p1 GENE.GHVS01026572.1~~GHVS01026572.1.p1  ORF type:complete len:624 (+),score=80.00 GHVS01026572.1:223-1872(+)
MSPSPPLWSHERSQLVAAIHEYVQERCVRYLDIIKPVSSFREYISPSLVAYLLYVLGPASLIGLSDTIKYGECASSVSFAAMKAAFLKPADALKDPCGSLSQAFLRTSLTVAGEKASKDKIIVEKCRLGLFRRLRIQGETAYAADKDGGRYPLSDLQQGLWLDLLSSSGFTQLPQEYHELTAKLATYASGGGLRQQFPMIGYMSGQTLIRVLKGLSRVDTLIFDNASPDIKLIVAIEGVNAEGGGDDKRIVVYGEQFGVGDLGPKEGKVGWDTVAQGISLVDSEPEGTRGEADFGFYVSGTGSLLTLFSMEFLLREEFIYPIYRGILVVKKHTAYDPIKKKCLEDQLVTYAVTRTLVCSVIEITLKDYLTDVELIDPHPGGLEPTDRSPDFSLTLFPHWRWWLPPCFKQTLKDVSTWSCRYLSPGYHKFSSVLSANLPGGYAVPPAIARALSQPEVMGSSVGGELGFVVVREGEENIKDKFALYGVQQPSSWSLITDGQPKGCPRCEDGSSCNPLTGKCGSTAGAPSPPARRRRRLNVRKKNKRFRNRS